MKHYLYLLCFLLLVAGNEVKAQGLVSVNNFTGTANVAIPLFNVTNGSVSVPVTAVYNGGGLKVKDIEGNTGMGWNVNPGGGIYRTVRGLPDDVKKDTINSPRLGWLYNDYGTRINGFTIQNTGTPDCYTEGADASYIRDNFLNPYDTEPDIYNVSVPGLSCQLVLDASHNFQVIPYRDIKVSYVTNSGTGRIVSFTITNGQGVKYLFADTEDELKTLHTGDPDSVLYFKRDYTMYKNGVGYSNTWRLTSMTDLRGNSINFHYNVLNTYRDTPFRLAPGGSGPLAQFHIKEVMTALALNYIGVNNPGGTERAVLGFSHYDYIRTGFVITGISGYGKNVTFSYVEANKRGPGVYGREFLHQINVDDQQFTFTYKGLSTSVADPRISLPDSTSNKIDLWGYYNGSSASWLLPKEYVNFSNTSLERYRNIYPGTNISSYPDTIAGAHREAVPDSAKIGSLDSIKYSKGGFTTITYESNDYYDPTAGAVIKGGGIRVKQVQDFDGINTTKVSVRNYKYTDPSTGISTGKPIALPIYEFTTPYYGTDPPAEYSTVRSEDDLSPEDKTIIYGKVTLSQPGSGSTLYEYTTPATWWNSSLPADWGPTMTYVARSDCSTFSHATSIINNYPFPYNPNYDFERGLLTKVTGYKDSTNVVNESTYTYARTAAPTIISAFKYDENLDVINYAKYAIYVNTEEMTATVTNKVYNLGSTSTYKTDSVHYYYASAYHKLLTQQKTINSDGSINRTNYKYVKDYAATSGSDSTNNALYHLQQLNCNIPVETWYQVERDSNRTVGAQLVKFAPFNFSGAYQYLPAHQLKFISGKGVTDFSPSSISSGVFQNDSRYITTGNYLTYDALGNLLTADDNNRHVSTVLTDTYTHQTVAAFANARFNEIGFMNFDNTIPNTGFDGTFTISPNGRTGYGVTMDISDVHTRTFVINPQAKNYIFSVWINAASAAIMYLNISSGSYTHYYSISCPGNGKYTYYEMKIPIVSGMGSSFTLDVEAEGSFLADDFVVYPDNAQAATYAYNSITRQKEAETNTNGKAAYYDYDQFNRPLHVYDNDKQIVQRRSYVTRNGSDPGGMGTVTIAGSSVLSTANFTASLPITVTNTDGLRYKWNFGDDTTHVTGTSSTITHTYASTGTYTVTLVTSSPYYPDKTVTTSITISSVTPTHYINIAANNLDDGTGIIIRAMFYSSTGSLMYTMSQSDLETGAVSVVPGTYTVILNVSGQAYNPGLGTGYSRIGVDSNIGYITCAPYTTGGGHYATYTFTLDMTSASMTYLDFDIQTVNCP